MQAAGMLRPQRRVQHMQQECVQQLLSKEGTYQEQDNLRRLLADLEQFSSWLKTAPDNPYR
jgi:hypothetical protein